MYCYLELDNGLEEIADAMTDLELSAGAKDIKDGIKVYLQDKRRETQEAVNKDLNLLGLRRWHSTKSLQISLPKHTMVI